jgi:hypothetical protein
MVLKSSMADFYPEPGKEVRGEDGRPGIGHDLPYRATRIRGAECDGVPVPETGHQFRQFCKRPHR